MDCIICLDEVGFTLILVTARLNKPTSPSFVSQAPAPQFWWWPSTEPLLASNIFLGLGVQVHIPSSGYLLTIFLYIIHKAHLGLHLLLFSGASQSFSQVPHTHLHFRHFLPSLPLRLVIQALWDSTFSFSLCRFLALLKQQREETSSLCPCYPTIAFKVHVWIKKYVKMKY